MKDPRPPALILGTGITALGAMRSLARAGITTYVAGTAEPMIRRSRWYRTPPFRVADDVIDRPHEWLNGVPFEQAVLIPCSDDWARRVATLDLSLRGRFMASTPPNEVLDLLVDKARFADALRHLDIPHPQTYVVNGIDDLDNVPDDVFERAFLKPRDSQRFFRHFGVKAIHVRSRAEAARQLHRLEALQLAMIVQEYVPGPASNHFFIDGFVDARGTIRSLLVRQRQRMYPLDFGNSSYMISVKPETADGAVTALTRLLDGIGHRGVFSAEFKLDRRHDVFRILEVNARAWWYVDFAARCGMNVCAQAYDDALGKPVSTIANYRIGQALVFPYYDFSACIALRRRRAITTRAWLRSWLGAMQPVFQFADPIPGLGAAVDLVMNRIRGRVRLPRAGTVTSGAAVKHRVSGRWHRVKP